MLFKEETVPSVLETGQGLGWRDRKKNPSVLCHAEAMAKCIKASFRSTDLCGKFLFSFFSGWATDCLDRAGTSNMQEQKIFV